jgi:predicted nuclease of restriction endonuclease-like (RecB) superfamily
MKTELDTINPLFLKIAELIDLAHQRVITTVNLAIVHTYYEIGKAIVEEEQQGEKRAAYGKSVLKEVSKRLNEQFGKGYSVDNLQNMRQFYHVYSNYETLSRNFILSWSHYLFLMRIDNPNERSFYEIEATNENWSLSTLKRQYDSSLYERLALSRDKDEVMKLATKGNTIEKPSDILKNPLTLEFLGLEEKNAYSESDLEAALLSKIQHFLLELGKGFLFEARQKRFTFDGEHFFVDLVFYNRLLQCYVLIDLKIKTLKHKDIGQMQMYVNYYDRNVKLNYEKPTIGILLCKKKNDAIVELTLPEDANIYASEYSLYLPDKQLLQQKLVTWMQEYEDGH